METNFTINGLRMTLTKSEKARQAYRAWNKSDCSTLDEAYGTCSYAKHLAYANCVHRACLVGYTRMKVFNCCTMTFNFGYLTINDDDGLTYFVWETKDNMFCCPLNWLEN